MSKLRKIALLILAVMFAAYPIASYADNVALTNDQMDEIAAGELDDTTAGDWVTLASAEEDTVEGQGAGGYKKGGDKNILKIESESQSQIQAVSNANVVDSGVAVQSNIANATDGAVDMNQSNTANVSNVSEKDTTKITISGESSVDLLETETVTEKNVTSSSETSSSSSTVTDTTSNSSEEENTTINDTSNQQGASQSSSSESSNEASTSSASSASEEASASSSWRYRPTTPAG